MEGYFPQGVWYDISDDATVDASTAGRFVKLKAPLGHTPVHVMGGAIVPMQVLLLPAARLSKTQPHMYPRPLNPTNIKAAGYLKELGG